MRRAETLLRVALVVFIVLSCAVSRVIAGTISPGDILVADQGSGSVHHYSAFGTNLEDFASELALPSWITADKNGNVYVTEYGGNRVRKFSPSGVNLLTLTTAYTPGGVAISSDGTIFVVHYDGGAIHHYSAAGQDLGLFATPGGDGTDFIKLSPAGDLYVADWRNGFVRHISLTGVDLGNFITGVAAGPEGIAFDATDNLYVGNYLHFIIKKFSPSGTALGTFATETDPGSSYGLAFDTDGNLYAADFGGANIRKFGPSGADLGIFASAALVGPRDLVVVPQGGPATKDECQDGGWEMFDFPRTFKNQGDCVQFVETGK